MAIREVTLSLDSAEHTLVYDADTNKYRKEISVPTKSSYNLAEHVYEMLLKVTDQAGNITAIDKNDEIFGELMKLRVKETVAPIISIIKPSEGAYLTANEVQIEFSVTDNDSGVNPDTIALIVDGKTETPTKTVIQEGYKCTHIIMLEDGNEHTMEVHASDFDGNEAIRQTVNFIVDTVPPMLNLINPTGNLITNQEQLVISGMTNDVTSGPCTVMVKVNAMSQGAVTVVADGTFSKTVTLANGTNTITVRSTDKAGKYSEVTRTVIYDSDAPVVLSISITPNPVNAGDIITIEVEATD